MANLCGGTWFVVSGSLASAAPSNDDAADDDAVEEAGDEVEAAAWLEEGGTLGGWFDSEAGVLDGVLGATGRGDVLVRLERDEANGDIVGGDGDTCDGGGGGGE